MTHFVHGKVVMIGVTVRKLQTVICIIFYIQLFF